MSAGLECRVERCATRAISDHRECYCLGVRFAVTGVKAFTDFLVTTVND
jgi:hypothetical protein